jgi:hypothetical protein
MSKRTMKQKQERAMTKSVLGKLGFVRKHTSKFIDWRAVYNIVIGTPMELGSIFNRVGQIVSTSSQIVQERNRCSKCGHVLKWEVLGQSKKCTGCGKVYKVKNRK